MRADLQRQIYDSRMAGRHLSAAIQQGAPIQSIPTPIRLRPGERCVGTAHVGLMQFIGADVSWTETRGGGWGIGSMLVMGAVNAVGNSRREAQARRDAAPQWRMVEQGQMWLTDLRFAIQASEWVNLWHENVDFSTCDGLSVEVHYSGMPPTRICLPYADWWYVMMHWIAFAELKIPPPPDPPGP